MQEDFTFKSISILGCGWLGFPLALDLKKHKLEVSGSTTTKEKLELLVKNGIEPYMINLPKIEKHHAPFFESDVLIVNVPPRLRQSKLEEAKNQLNNIVETLHKSTKKPWLIYTSTTGVYSGAGTKNEDATSLTPHYQELETCINNYQGKTTIIRFSGLFDDDRPIINHLSGKSIDIHPEETVNLIHREDAIGLIIEIVKKQFIGVINGTCPKTSNKEEFYMNAANKFALAKPNFTHKENKAFKTIETKHSNIYDYKFKSALDFLT